MSKGDNSRPFSVSMVEFGDNFSKIFGDKPVQRGRFKADKVTNKLIPLDEWNAKYLSNEQHHMILPDIEEFKDPSGVVISSRSKFRDHLRATDSIEMGHSDIKWAEKNKVKRMAEAKRTHNQERKQELIHRFNQ